MVSWPMYRRFENSMGDRPTPAAILMVTLLMICVIIPLSFLSVAVAQQLPGAIRAVSGAITNFTVPLWLNDIPGIGTWLYEQSTMLFQPRAMAELLEKLVNPLSRQVVTIAMTLGNGLVQLLLVALIAFFFIDFFKTCSCFWICLRCLFVATCAEASTAATIISTAVKIETISFVVFIIVNYLIS
jgi:predicted PurR-regulated permease PerM